MKRLECELCGERKRDAVVRQVPDRDMESYGRYSYYVDMVICDACMEKAERQAEGPDPDQLYDEMIDRQMARRWSDE